MTDESPKAINCQSAPLADRAAKIRQGKRDPEAYIRMCCHRIASANDQIHAFREESGRESRLIAAYEEPQGPDDRGLLEAMPVGIKDIIHVKGFETRAGSALPPELFAGAEATLVHRLREAGAVIAGKTVTTEFAGFAPGRTRNPRALAYTPGGSSSGSAAAVAAGMVPLAIGTQTGGSVIRPAAFCGIVGFKPTVDRIPTTGVIDRSWTIDTVGTFTQTLAGARLAGTVLCDTWTPVESASKPRIGIPTGPYRQQTTVAGEQAFTRHCQTLEAAGMDLQPQAPFADYQSIETGHRRLSAGEFARVHAQWFPEYEPFYRTTTARRLREGATVTDEQLRAARATIDRRREHVETRMANAGIDLWVTPAAPGPPPAGRSSTGSSVMNRPWTFLGMPAVTVPAGTIDGRPVGLQCVSRQGTDEQLLTWAKHIATAMQ